MKKIKYKNLLVQYKGGGYDGCHWEWNYFIFDSTGKWHDIASSGYNGIETENTAMDYLKDHSKINGYSSEYYTYNLKKADDIKKFQDDSAPEHIEGVGKKVNTIYNAALFFFECDECSEKVFFDNVLESQMFHTGCHGNGGIGVQIDGKLCESCYCSASCGYCGDYVGEHDDEDWADLNQLVKKHKLNEKQKKQLEDELQSSYCTYCAERFIKKLRKG